MDHQPIHSTPTPEMNPPLVRIRPRTKASDLVERKGLYIKTFGCQMNEYDTQKLKKLLEDGYKSVERPEDADLILINTCSVRDKPEKKLFSMLGELQELKKTNPSLLIGVGGCVAQQEGETIIKRNKNVDLVFGTHNLSLVPSMVELRQNGAPPQVSVDYRDEWEELPAGFPDVNRVSVFVSISRGCNKNCSYCIVPTTRGKEVSRHPKEIERETRIAAHRGAKEIVLLGQTVNSYGRDLKPQMKFTDLMRNLSQIDAIKRIRFVSPHPQEIRQDFFDLLAEDPKICRHVHMPLQSGNDRILKLMNRNYRRERYLQIIEEMTSRTPEMAVTTDVIIGFPGETEEEFLDTVSVLETVRFVNSYSYIFSPRPGTEAALLEDTLPREEKLRRLQYFQAKQEEIIEQRLAEWVGKEGIILLDRPSISNDRILQGRLSQNIMVNLNKEYPELSLGMFVKVKITAQKRYTLLGDVIGVCEEG